MITKLWLKFIVYFGIFIIFILAFLIFAGFVLIASAIYEKWIEERSDLLNSIYYFFIINFALFFITLIPYAIIPLVLNQEYNWLLYFIISLAEIIPINYLVICNDFLVYDTREEKSREIGKLQSKYLVPGFFKTKFTEDKRIWLSFLLWIITIAIIFFSPQIYDNPNFFKIYILVTFFVITIYYIIDSIIAISNIHSEKIESTTRRIYIEKAAMGIFRLSFVSYLVLWFFDINLFDPMFTINQLDFYWLFLVVGITIILFLISLLIYRRGEQRSLKNETKYIDELLTIYQDVKKIIEVKDLKKTIKSLTKIKKLLLQIINSGYESIHENAVEIFKELKEQEYDIQERIDFYFTERNFKKFDKNLKESYKIYSKFKLKEIKKKDESFHRNITDLLSKFIDEKILKDFDYQNIEDISFAFIYNKLKDMLDQDRIRFLALLYPRLTEKITEFNIDDYHNWDSFYKIITKIFSLEFIKKLTSLDKYLLNQIERIEELICEIDFLTKHQEKIGVQQFKNWTNQQIIIHNQEKIICESRNRLKTSDTLIRGIFWLLSNIIIGIFLKQILTK